MSKKKPYIRTKPRQDSADERYPEAMRDLLHTGVPTPGASYAKWADELRDYVPQLIQMVLDPDLSKRNKSDMAVWAPVHALSVLAELAAPEAVEPLLAVLAWDDDWMTGRVIDYYGAVGAAALPVLQAYAQDANRDMHGRTIAISSLGAIAEKHPGQREEVVSFLAGLLDQPPAETADEETVAASIVVKLLELKAEEALPAIHRAFDEDRVDTNVVHRDDIEWLLSDEQDEGLDDIWENEDVEGEGPENLPEPEDGPLTLMLKCKACGRERQYTFERAYYDLGTVRHRNETEDSPLLVPERVVCPKCGAVDQYEIGTFTEFAIKAKLSQLSGIFPDRLPQLEVVDFTSERWGWVAPRQLPARYESEIAAHPNDVSLRLGYANTLRKLGYRDRALEAYDQVLLMDPSNGDALISIAQMKAEFAPFPEAIAAWEDVERRFESMSWRAEERELRRAEVEDTLEVLRSESRPDYLPKLVRPNRPSGTEIAPAADRLPTGPTPLEMQAQALAGPTRPAASPYGKVGRNEPCPCGSGKKYKQCHGKK